MVSPNIRDFCCRAQPESIPSNTAAASSRWTTPSTSTSRADPGTSANATFPCQLRVDIVNFKLTGLNHPWWRHLPLARSWRLRPQLTASMTTFRE